MINANKPERWNDDIASSIDLYNRWFLEFAPKTFRETRAARAGEVLTAMRQTRDLAGLGTTVLYTNPGVLRTLRMSTSPPLAVDRLVGLADTKRSLVNTLGTKKLPQRMSESDLRDHLERIAATISEVLDVDLFPWLETCRLATDQERTRAAHVVADRLCGAVANPIIRNAQEHRQFTVIRNYLKDQHYSEDISSDLREMPPGTFAFQKVIRVTMGQSTVRIPIDIAVQPQQLAENHLPILIEAKSAGDFTNTNKRRKEEATKVRQLRSKYGSSVRYILFLGGYFDSGYLGYEAAEGIDWVWGDRVSDLQELGL